MLKTAHNIKRIQNPFIFKKQKKIFLIDNACYNYCNDPSQGIPILPYYGGTKAWQCDSQLNRLGDYLDCLVDADKKDVDIVELNRIQFQNDRVMHCDHVHQALDIMLK